MKLKKAIGLVGGFALVTSLLFSPYSINLGSNVLNKQDVSAESVFNRNLAFYTEEDVINTLEEIKTSDKDETFKDVQSRINKGPT